MEYRTIIILEKLNGKTNFIFGHSIFWKKGNLDYTISSWKKKEISNFTIWFCDIAQVELKKIESSLNENKFIFQEINLSNLLPFSLKTNQFLEAGSKQYNPFISLCTERDIFFRKQENALNLNYYIEQRKEIFEKINDEFGIDLLKNTHMIETFSIYRPTRLYFRIHGDKKDKDGLIIKAYDNFNLYSDHTVELTLFDEEIETKEYEFTLKDLYIKNKIECGFNPSRAIIKVKSKEKEIIYSNDSYFIKKIILTMGIAKTPINTGKEIIQRFTKETIEIENND